MKHRKVNWNCEEVNMKRRISHMKHRKVNWNRLAAECGEVPHTGIVLPPRAARKSQCETRHFTHETRQSKFTLRQIKLQPAHFTDYFESIDLKKPFTGSGLAR